jgi:hypothetical protein
MKKRTANYKPLLFTTTMRNPERLKDFLTVFSDYEGEILTNLIIEKVVKTLIMKGLYKPTKISQTIKNKWKNEIELTDIETETVFVDNPQSHKEAGFERGWASRFDTWYKLGKELGFVYYWVGEKIEFSESGKMLLDREKPENETMIFANAFAKFYRHNPFKRVANTNVPLILLLETIQLLNKDTDFNNVGISKREIPLLLCWQNNNANDLYLKIKELRKKYAYKPSDEVILEICYDLLDDTKRDDSSLLSDYPDDFIRKMRLTGLISLRGGGRFIDINSKELATVNYIIENYKTHATHITEKEFYNYIGTIDNQLISKLTIYKSPIRTTKKELEKWVNHYEWEIIKAELLNLATKKSSKDEILKVIEQPLRLEFLTSLAILKKLPNVNVKPNFISDDEGLPTSFAQGGNPDIECLENQETFLIEVTLLTGTQQHIRESYSIQRHLNEYVSKGTKASTLFISPKVFTDTCEHSAFIKFKYNLDVRILDIDLFVLQLETQATLWNVAYEASSCK